MKDSGSQPSEVDLLERLRVELGVTSESSLDQKLPEVAEVLREYVRAPGREPVENYQAIREFLQTHWKISVIETGDPVWELEQLGGAQRSIGRCGVRLLDLLGRADIHIVVERDPSGGEQQMLWTLLHEMGHFAWHFELLQSVSAVYQRICLNPGLELELAKFGAEEGRTLRGALELEADLFAVDWLIPRWWFGEESPADLPVGLTLDGLRFFSLRRAFAAPPFQLSEAAVAKLNEAGAGERRRSEGSLAAGATRWARASWLLWNRERFGSSLSTGLIEEYDRIVGGGGRYVPEFRQPVLVQGEIDPSFVWLPRIEPEVAPRVVDDVHWMPLLVPAEGPYYPEYNIPIRPLPSQETRDSRVPWSHMFKPPTQKPLPLQTWIDRARDQQAGLLLFPRTPAERALDSSGVPRP